MPNKLSYEKFKEIYSTVPRLCVDIVITNDESAVLLTYRQIEPAGFWHLPGGTVLFGELVDAVKRVAKAELGLDVEVKDNIGVIDFSQSHISFDHGVSIVYLVKVIRGEIKLDYQASEAGYFKKLPKDTLKLHADFLTKNVLNR